MDTELCSVGVAADRFRARLASAIGDAGETIAALVESVHMDSTEDYHNRDTDEHLFRAWMRGKGGELRIWSGWWPDTIAAVVDSMHLNEPSLAERIWRVHMLEIKTLGPYSSKIATNWWNRHKVAATNHPITRAMSPYTRRHHSAQVRTVTQRINPVHLKRLYGHLIGLISVMQHDGAPDGMVAGDIATSIVLKLAQRPDVQVGHRGFLDINVDSTMKDAWFEWAKANTTPLPDGTVLMAKSIGQVGEIIGSVAGSTLWPRGANPERSVRLKLLRILRAVLDTESLCDMFIAAVRDAMAWGMPEVETRQTMLSARVPDIMGAIVMMRETDVGVQRAKRARISASDSTLYFLAQSSAVGEKAGDATRRVVQQMLWELNENPGKRTIALGSVPSEWFDTHGSALRPAQRYVARLRSYGDVCFDHGAGAWHSTAKLERKAFLRAHRGPMQLA
jgi:hypothetical protein